MRCLDQSDPRQDTTMISTPCPLAYCDPGSCGWRAKDASCEWQDDAIDTTSDAEDDCDD